MDGDVHVPGDKSISHRALILGALIRGRSYVGNLSPAADVAATARVLQECGGSVRPFGDGRVSLDGAGPGVSLRSPSAVLDCANSGTTMRLMAGVLAAHDVVATLAGDGSLVRRPMERVAAPLRSMGADVQTDAGHAPLVVRGTQSPLGIEHQLAVASAQVKSAILLAGLNAQGATVVREPLPTRDHTERLLKHFGARLTSKPHGEHGRRITLQGQPELEPANVVVPADPSSAAFPMVAGLLVPGSDLILEAVMTNPLRTGLLTTLREMGANVEVVATRDDGGEEVADLRVRTSALKGVDVPAERAPSMIDEYPILAVAASFAQGVTRMRGLKELRVKESDRLEATAAMLRANGVTVEIEGDDLIVQGKASVAGGGEVLTHMDHRIAMAALVMGLASDNPVRIDDGAFIATSFPGFVELMRSLGADLS